MSEIDHPILFFDGLCNLCNGAVKTVLEHDRRGSLRFASLQSELADRLLRPRGIDPDELQSLVLYHEGQVYTHSTAALQTAKLMGGPMSLMYYLKVFPRFMRDRVYNFVARNRYRWFGKREACMLPRPEWKARFLSV